MKRSAYSIAREEFRDATDLYWQAITQPGWSADTIEQRRWRVAAAAVKLRHIEQGMRGAESGR